MTVRKRVSEKLKKELWGFCALIGLFSVHTGIVLTVFALKDMTSQPEIIKAFGILLILLGVAATLSSWYFHRQQREKRPAFPCCRKSCSCCSSPSTYEDDLLERTMTPQHDPRARRSIRTHVPFPDSRSKRESVSFQDQPTTKRSRLAGRFSMPKFRVPYLDFLKGGGPRAPTNDDSDSNNGSSNNSNNNNNRSVRDDATSNTTTTTTDATATHHPALPQSQSHPQHVHQNKLYLHQHRRQIHPEQQQQQQHHHHHHHHKHQQQHPLDVSTITE